MNSKQAGVGLSLVASTRKMLRCAACRTYGCDRCMNDDIKVHDSMTTAKIIKNKIKKNLLDESLSSRSPWRSSPKDTWHLADQPVRHHSTG